MKHESTDGDECERCKCFTDEICQAPLQSEYNFVCEGCLEELEELEAEI